ncbi:MAG: hypothetical protein K0M78_09580, partial [Brevundimonas sp.]|nr:hypothetical protein [Brevundimonas sp.]
GGGGGGGGGPGVWPPAGAACRDAGAETLEGYPVAADTPQAAAFVWTGTVPLFARAGFVRVDDKPSGKVRMRRTL